MGLAGVDAQAGAANNLYSNLADIYGNLYGYRANQITNAGQSYANNLMGTAGQMAEASPWAGINQAVQGGIGNYLYAKGAGLNNPKPTHDFQGRVINYG